MKLGLQHQGLKLYKVYINDDPGLTLTYFIFKPATNGQSDKGSLLTSNVVKGFSAFASGQYTYIKSLKMCIKSDFFF